MVPPSDDWLREHGFTPEFIHFHDIAYPPPHKERTMSSYAKAIVAFFTSLGTWGATALAVGTVGEPASISGVEWFGLCGVIVATVGVYAMPNTPTEDV